MSAVQPIRIMAQVDNAERNAVRTGAELLSASVAFVRPEGKQPIELGFVPLGIERAALPSADVFLASLLPELSRRPEPGGAIFGRWADHLRAVQEKAKLVFVWTVFRHLPGRDRSAGSSGLLKRIRELNLMAVELSHALGVRVIDIDRNFAHFGARTLDTDFRLRGDYAADVAGHAIASAILAGGLDDLIDPMLQESARARLGGLDAVPALHSRRRQARSARAATDG